MKEADPTQQTESTVAIAPSVPHELPAIESERDLPRMLLHVAWAAILVGICLQLLILLASMVMQSSNNSFATFLRDVSQKITWSTIVCLGLALGTAAAKARAAWAGVAGLLAAPVALVSARAAQKGMSGATGLAPPAEQPVALFFAILLIKAIQYGVFGAVLAWLNKRDRAGLGVHIGIGAAAGVIFGAMVVGAQFGLAASQPKPAAVISQAINEIVFPIGCAITLYIAGKLAPRLSG